MESTSKHTLSDEQQAIVAHNGSGCVDAVAGSGKTTTLVEYAKARPDERKLCVVYNRSARLLNQERFREAGCNNVRVETAHSLAYKGVDVGRRYTLLKNGLSVQDIVSLCGLKPKPSEPAHHFSLSSNIHKALTLFCNSLLRSFSELDYAKSVNGEEAHVFAKGNSSEIIGSARDILGQMYQGRLGLIHDAYLKFFHLSQPSMSMYDVVMVDEAQDISGSMLDIYMNQPTRCLLVGDAHQGIYGFRHAVNAMAQAPYPRLALSRSFRFGPKIANKSYSILRGKKRLDDNCRLPVIKGCGPGEGTDGSSAILARGNLELVKQAMAQMKSPDPSLLHFEGGLHLFTCLGEGSSLYDLLFLRLGKTDKVRSSFIKSFPDYSSIKEYIENTSDAELRLACEIVEEYGMLLFSLMKRLKEKSVEEKQKADIILSTVHKAKGSEYDTVYLAGDFMYGETLSTALNRHDIDQDPSLTRWFEEEINIAYVAATRAKRKLHLNAPSA